MGQMGVPRLRPEQQVAAAVADLGARCGVEPAEVAVVRVAEVVWPDASLGCPRPGRSYAQALTPGTLVVLSVAGRRYSYHAAAGRPPLLCEHPKAPLSSRPDTQSDTNP